MPIFENKALTVAFIASILSFVPYYYFLGKEKLRIVEQLHVRLFFGLWLAAFTFEYYFLGPYSFIEQTTEGNLNVTVNYYLTHGYDGGVFSHQYAGGQDIYTLLFGKHFFNPERTLIGLFPLWIAILLHKVYIAALGFIGAYLLVRHVWTERRAGAAALAAIFPVSHLYLLNFSTNWAPGFSALPLMVYLCVARSRQGRYWPGVALAAIVMAPADPIHVFPALAVAVFAGIFLLPVVNIKRVAVSFLILVLASIANWYEVLFAFYQNVALTSRMEGHSGFDLDFLEAAWFAVGYVASRLKIPGVLLLLSLLVLAIARDGYFKKALWATAIWVFSFALAEGLPWGKLGLEAIGQLSHYYMLLSLVVIFLPITARALADINTGANSTFRRLQKIRPEVVLLASALSFMTWDKAVNFANFIWFGGQANLFAYETLKNTSWRPDEDFRVVTLHETPNANIVAGMYGLDTFDGQLNMNNAAWQDYWYSIVRRDSSHALTARVGVKWDLWDGRFYDAGKNIRLDLLGIANVRFLLSGLPLKGAGLKLVSAPPSGTQAKEAWPKTMEARVDFLKNRLKRIPGRLFQDSANTHRRPRKFRHNHGKHVDSVNT